MKLFTWIIIGLIAIATIVYLATGKLLWDFIFNGSVIGDYIMLGIIILVGCFVLFVTGMAIYNLIKDGW